MRDFLAPFLLSLIFFQGGIAAVLPPIPSIDGPICKAPTVGYPNFDNNPFITGEMHQRMAPYLLPLSHPLKAALDGIFNQTRAIENEKSFDDAGFITLFKQQISFIRVAKHPALKGYLMKVYLDSELRQRRGLPGWLWLTERCKGAEKIRKLIEKKKLKYFSVPDKWLYPLPIDPSPVLEQGQSRQTVVLLVTDMKLTSQAESWRAWREKVTTRHLDELYCILSHGFSSTYLITNIPYTTSGKFTCIDTEHPKRKLDYQRVKQYLSAEMDAYWDKLVQSKGAISSITKTL